jgi:hypothetical protein
MAPVNDICATPVDPWYLLMIATPVGPWHPINEIHATPVGPWHLINDICQCHTGGPMPTIN